MESSWRRWWRGKRGSCPRKNTTIDIISASFEAFGRRPGISNPALVAYALWAFSTDTNTNYISGGVEQRLAHLLKLGVAHGLSEVINGHGGD
jgi:hypothetical protein